MMNPLLIGYEKVSAKIRQAIARHHFPQSVLFTGPVGVGKGTMARYVAQTLLCSAETPPCGRCSACRRVEANSHPDLLILRAEEGRQFRIEQIRTLERFLHLTPREGDHKVIIIEDFQTASPGAANALLKTLEEPPPYAFLLLTADEVEHLLPTIRSRVRTYTLPLLPRSKLVEALQTQDATEEEADKVATLAAGRLGWALQAWRDPAILEECEQSRAALSLFLKSPLPERFAQARRWSEREERSHLPQRLEYWRLFWHETLLAQLIHETDNNAASEDERLTALVRSLPLQETARIVKLIGETLDALRRNVNPRLLMELLALELPTLPPP